MFVEEQLAGYEGATPQIPLFHHRQWKQALIGIIPSPSVVTWRCFWAKVNTSAVKFNILTQGIVGRVSTP